MALRRLFEYWCKLAAPADELPRIQDFDPVWIAQLLPYVWVVEVDPNNHRFRVRLAGEAINEVYGRNIGGKYFADVYDPVDADTIVQRYRRCLHEPAMLHAAGNVYAAAGRLCIGERLALPMLGRTGTTNTLIGMTCYGGTISKSSPLTTTGDVADYKVTVPNHNFVDILGP